MKKWERFAIREAVRDKLDEEERLEIWKQFSETGYCEDIKCKDCPFLSDIYCKDLGSEERLRIVLNEEV